MKEKILIVDDAVFMRTKIRSILEKTGDYDIFEAADGDTAIGLYHQEKPQLVLLDITMPGKSGIDVLKELIHYDSNANIVMCSAIGQESMIQKALEYGAKEFIVKPFIADDLQQTVEYSLNR